MRALVTGANGLLGRRLTALLSQRGHQVAGLARGPQRLTGPQDHFSVDLADEDALATCVRDLRPDVILNPGAMTDVDACESQAYAAFRVNGVAPGVLAFVAQEIGAHLVHVSTDYVFDGEAGPYSEDAIPNPRGVYALTKHMGEQAVQATRASWAIARTAVVYGWPPADRPNFGSWLLSALRNGEPVHLFEDQYVSPSFADSVAEQLAELAERRLSGFWNTCGAEVVNRVQFGRALCEEFQLDARGIVPTRLKEAKLKSPRPARSGLRTDKASALLAARPLALGESLARFRAVVEGTQK